MTGPGLCKRAYDCTGARPRILAFGLCVFACVCIPISIAQEMDAAHDGMEIMDVKKDGDLIIGGLFPIHEDGSSMGKHCAAIKPDKGVQRMEAMLWAVDQINKDRKLLPDVKIGVHILDTCHQDTHGLEQTLEFIKSSMSASNSALKYSCADGSVPQDLNAKPVVAVIGAANSQVSAMVANVLRLFKMPQISYSSTSSELSDKSRFEYFSRVVPPDDLQAEAMVDVVKNLGWTYVSAVSDEGNYGEQGMEQFRILASQKKICLATYEKIRRSYQDSDFNDLVLRLAQHEANGVVMFVHEDNVRKILKAMHDQTETGRLHRRFAFVASDSWGNKRTPVMENPGWAKGAITIQPKVTPIKDFDEYFKKLTPLNNKHDKWFPEFWRYQFNCTYLDKECLKNSLETNHVQEGYVPFVIDAVYVLAHALNATIRQHCFGKPYKKCSLYGEGINGTELLHHIRNISFVGPQGEEIQLDHRGNRMGRYNIYQFQGSAEQYRLVGTWTNNPTDIVPSPAFGLAYNDSNSTSRLTMNVSLVEDGYFSKKIPSSVCGQPCGQNQYRSRIKRDQCCWTCQDCNASSIMPNDSACIPCELGYLPHEVYKNECLPMIPQTMEWLSLWSIVPCCVSCIGIIATLFVFGVFFKYSKTPVIMASGRELCYMMLVGILLAYTMTFVLLNPPNFLTCAIIRLGLGTTLSIIYASILTKTSRLARIFTSNVRSMQRPKFISPRAQVIICSLLISGQLIGAIIWTTVEPPETTLLYPTRMEAVLSCKATATPTLLSLTYILLLICLCTVYAFKTRKIPENFNETKHIGFTMYATSIIWLAFVPIFFGTNNNFKVQITSMCTCISISASVALACFFAPKVYIVLFQPNKNVRPSANMSSFQKMQIGMVQQQMRFLRPKSDYESTVPTSQASQFSNPIGGKSNGSPNGDLQRLEESSCTTSFMTSGGGKRRRSSALKQLLPQSDSRHNRVGAISVVNSANNNANNLSSIGSAPLSSNRDSSASKNKNINVNVVSNESNAGRSGISSSLSSASSGSSNKKLTTSIGPPSFDDTRPFLHASSASTDRTGFIVSKRGSKSTSNRSSLREPDCVDEFSVSPRRSLEISEYTSRSISVSEASLMMPNPPVLIQQATAEDDEDGMTAVDLLLTSPSTPLAWTVTDPRSEFEIILTEISSQEGTFV